MDEYINAECWPCKCCRWVCNDHFGNNNLSRTYLISFHLDLFSSMVDPPSAFCCTHCAPWPVVTCCDMTTLSFQLKNLLINLQRWLANTCPNHTTEVQQRRAFTRLLSAYIMTWQRMKCWCWQQKPSCQIQHWTRSLISPTISSLKLFPPSTSRSLGGILIPAPTGFWSSLLNTALLL